MMPLMKMIRSAPVLLVFLFVLGLGTAFLPAEEGDLPTELKEAGKKVRKLAGGMKFTEARCGCRRRGFSCSATFPTAS